MLAIQHVSGPLAGRNQTIEPAASRVTFGRDAEVCDVVFPTEAGVVSRRHFALLRKPNGSWTVDLFGDPFVAINGLPAEIGQAVHSGDLIELGRRGGPAFKIVLSGPTGNDQLAVTLAQERVDPPRVAATKARRLALLGVSLALVAAITAGSFLFYSTSEGARLEKAVATLADTQAKAAADSISAGVRERLLQASYVVVRRFASGQETAVGTASPVRPNMLATNAHIVEIRETLPAGDRMFVRAPGPEGKTYEVTAARKHPGYDAFNEFLKVDPIYVVSSKECPNCYPSSLQGSASYDVGTLTVADGANLGPILEVAGPDELLAVKAGTPLAMAGYPLERIQGREVQAMGATPSLSVGMATAMTDMFNMPAEPAFRRLVQHNLPGTGGNSGSPMVNAAGRLVAFHNSGSYIHVPNVGRVPNAAMIRFGQRADLLLDMLSGQADRGMDAERAYWAKQTAAFKRGFDALVPHMLQAARPSPTATSVLVSQTKHTLTKSEQFRGKDRAGKDVPRRQRIHPVTLKAGRPASFIGYAQESATIQMYLVVNGSIVAKDESASWYPDLTYLADSDTRADVYIVGGDVDATYTLLEYAWDVPRS